MPAIDRWLTVALTAPTWVWIGVAAVVAGVAVADDRTATAKAGVGWVADLSRDVQLVAGFAIGGFVAGLLYPPAQLAAMAGGAI